MNQQYNKTHIAMFLNASLTRLKTAKASKLLRAYIRKG